MQNIISPIRNSMVEQKSQPIPLLIDANNVIGNIPHNPLEATDDPRKRKSHSTNINMKRQKVETKNVEQNVECNLGDTQLHKLHKFLQHSIDVDVKIV